jgi:hypothetical protein
MMNGGQEATSEILLDGVTANTAHYIPNIHVVSAIPTLDSVQEVRVQTNAFSAEYGRSGGGVVTLASRSGTNQIHGSAFEYLRNSKLDSNNYFANQNGLRLANFQRHQFGGSLGGPVEIPRLYRGRDRTFFFLTFEGIRQDNAQNSQQSVPTDLERRGDFSRSLNSAGQLIAIYDPFSTRPDPARPGRFLRNAFPGNVIPASQINPVAANVQKYIPQPNSAGLPFTQKSNLVQQGSYPEPMDRFSIKGDHNFSDTRRIFGRYTYQDMVNGKPNFWDNVADPGCCGPNLQRLQNIALDYTQTFGTSKVLNLRYGLGRVSGNRVAWSSTLQGPGGFSARELGLPSYIDAISDHPVFPTFTIQDYTAPGPVVGDLHFLANTTHTAIANLSSLHGRHSVRFGMDARFNFVNWIQLNNPSGNFAFNRTFTQGPDPRTASTMAGIGYASFLLGTGTGSISHQVRPAVGNRYYAAYIQDDFKVTSKLTLNLGFRWDFETGVTERFDHLAAIDPYARNPLSGVTGRNLLGSTLYAGGTLGRRAIRGVDPKQLNPRIGFAYALGPNTAIRAGYGVFFGLPSYSAVVSYQGSAFNTSTPWISTVDGDDITPLHLLSDPFPNGFRRAPGAEGGPNASLGSALTGGWPEALRPVYNQQWNFTIQRGFGRDMVWEIAYAGNKGTRLSYPAQLNQLHPSFLALGDQLLQTVPNPFFGLIDPVLTLGQANVQRGQLLRPYPHQSAVTAANAGWASSNYHALQTRFEKRFSRGFSFLASYTFSKTISDTADGVWFSSNGVRNQYCRTCERAVSAYDQPHRFVTNFTYELPFGRGKWLGAGWGGWMNNIFGEWQINGILTLSQGQPLRNIGVSTDTSFSFGGLQRPDSTGVHPGLDQPTINRWFDTPQFRTPARFTFGNLGRTVHTIRGDGAEQFDFSVFKRFRIAEEVRLELRAEAFNLLNKPMFELPGATLGSPFFGVVRAQQNLPRQVQLALRIAF